jgi:hypothetical protein
MPAIPPPGTKYHIDAIRSTYPNYNANVEHYQFLRDSFEGSGGYEAFRGRYWSHTGTTVAQLPDYTYLQRFSPRESAARWERRVEGAYYPNFIKWLVAIMKGLITRETPKRQEYPNEILDWIGSAEFNTKYSQMLAWALVYGRLYAIVMKERGVRGISAANTQSGETYVDLIHPDRVYDYAYGNDGELRYFKYGHSIDLTEDPLAAEHITGERIWVFTRDGWFYFDVLEKNTSSEIAVQDSGMWDASIRGTVPIAAYDITGDLDRYGRPRSIIEHPAQVMRRLYNVLSQKSSIEDGSCFPVLIWPARSPEDLKKLQWDSSTAIPYPMESSHTPAFIGYDVKPIEHMTNEAARLILKLKQIVSLAFDEDAGATGIAKAYAFLQTNVTLASIVDSIERFELDILELVCMWENISDGMPDNATPGYTRRFELTDAQAEIEMAGALLEMEYGPIARREIKRHALMAKYLQDLPSEVVQEIERELEEEATDVGADEQEYEIEEMAPIGPQLQKKNTEAK